jgi:hypothetical protein
MSIAAAIQKATGFVAGHDFSVQDHGKGPFLAVWPERLGARPSDAQIASWLAAYKAGEPAREGQTLLGEILSDYLSANIVQQEFGDNTRLLAVKAKIAAWKPTHPGVTP